MGIKSGPEKPTTSGLYVAPATANQNIKGGPFVAPETGKPLKDEESKLTHEEQARGFTKDLS